MVTQEEQRKRMMTSREERTETAAAFAANHKAKA